MLSQNYVQTKVKEAKGEQHPFVSSIYGRPRNVFRSCPYTLT